MYTIEQLRPFYLIGFIIEALLLAISPLFSQLFMHIMLGIVALEIIGVFAVASRRADVYEAFFT